MGKIDPMKLSNKDFNMYIKETKRSAKLTAELIKIAGKLDLIGCPLKVFIQNKASLKEDIIGENK